MVNSALLVKSRHRFGAQSLSDFGVDLPEGYVRVNGAQGCLNQVSTLVGFGDNGADLAPIVPGLDCSVRPLKRRLSTTAVI